jgi:hypothetical protein
MGHHIGVEKVILGRALGRKVIHQRFTFNKINMYCCIKMEIVSVKRKQGTLVL